MKLINRLIVIAVVLWAAGCNADKHCELHGATQPSEELQKVLRAFIAGDTLNKHPKYYAAFIRQELSTGNLSVYLQDQYGSTGKPSPYPTTTWVIDKKLFFVFTGLEAISNSYDTTHHHIIRRFEKTNADKFWSPEVRTWKISIKGRKIMTIDVISFIPLFYSSDDPPPPPLIYKDEEKD